MPPFTTLFFDLDDTLYPSASGLWQEIRVRITAYMRERMDFSEEQVAFYRKKYLETYGTTLRGLQIHHSVDTDDFLDYVHDLPLDEFLEPAPQLGDLITSLPQRRWVFTNADAAHAERVLRRLQIENAFEGIIDVRAVEFTSKPSPESFQRAMKIAQETDASRCVLFDDSPKNTAAAGQHGLFTVLVGDEENKAAADLSLRSLQDMRHRMPELWS